MGKLKGIPVTLIGKTVTGENPFGEAITIDFDIEVDNVLVAPASTEDITSQLSLTGKKIVYTLAIPKGDTNDWVNKEVRFFGRRFRTVGMPLEGIEELIPMGWNRKVQVENYE